MAEIDRSLIGTWSEPFVVDVEKGAIRKFAEAIGDPNPLYFDERFARQHGYPGLLAPPTFPISFRPPFEPSWSIALDRRRILAGEFPSHILEQFRGMIDYFGESPYIVRSSSILEDARGNAFSGKYESVFVVNLGSREERMAALLDAVRSVYASVLDEQALLYRRRRGLLESEERMALLIMRVSTKG